ncbi:MAG: MFS transporter [Promethearchaeota archaeon]|nr:MAG: MFS transporter [Candidatus Lokiarchaeota archaeon]
MAIEEDLSEWEIAPTSKMIAYGFGYLIINYLLGAYSAIVFYYYEVEVGLPVLFVGIAFVLYAIWNMFNDPLLGYFTDKPRKWTRKWGLRTPWVVLSSFPILICYFLIFTPPNIDPKENALTIFLYMLAVTALFDTFFSIFNTHVYGGFVNQFRTEYERRRGFAVIIAVAGIGVVGIGLIPPFIIEYGNRDSFVLSALVVVSILAICNIFLFLGIKESEDLKERLIKGFENAEDTSFFSIMKVALNKKNFAISLTAYTTIITAQTLATASGIYMLKDVFRVPFTYAVLTGLAGFAGYMLSIPFWSNYARKHGFKRTYYVSLLFAGICYFPTLFITEIWQAVLFTLIGGIPYAGYTLMTMPVASDTMDEVALEMGRRQDGTLQGIRNFFFRIAIVVQGVVITVIHIITGYNPDPNATQTPLAIIGIRIHAGLIPALLMLTISLIVYKWYTLEGENKAEMVRKLKDLGL